MNIKKYMSFLKWFFAKIGDNAFDDDVPKRHGYNNFIIRRKDRLTFVILAYLMIILSLILLLIGRNGFHFIALVLIISSVSLLYGCQFSFLYYSFAYIRFINKDRSFNDRIIFEHEVIFNYPTDVTKALSKYFKIFEVKGSVFKLKFYLGARSKKRRKETNFKTIVLKITPKRIYFDGKVIFNKKLFDISELEKRLSVEATELNL